MTTATQAPPDVFASINSHTIPELAAILGIPGELREGMNLSPLREERTPSFSVYAGGYKFKDHSSGVQGDGVAFVGAYLQIENPREIREAWMEREGVNRLDGYLSKRALPKPKAPPPPKRIQWPGTPSQATQAAWSDFARRYGYSFKEAWVMVHCGALRFMRLSDRTACYVVGDRTGRCAEIRRIDGRLFQYQNRDGKPIESKAYPLKGPDKSWPVGLDNVQRAPRDAGILLCEGASDYLAAIALYTRYKTQGGKLSWIPAGLLGAGNKSLCHEAKHAIRGRTVRIVPDGDKAGAAMAAHWVEELKALGCPVEVMEMPEGKDLRDVMNETNPSEIYG